MIVAVGASAAPAICERASARARTARGIGAGDGGGVERTIAIGGNGAAAATVRVILESGSTASALGGNVETCRADAAISPSPTVGAGAIALGVCVTHNGRGVAATIEQCRALEAAIRVRARVEPLVARAAVFVGVVHFRTERAVLPLPRVRARAVAAVDCVSRHVERVPLAVAAETAAKVTSAKWPVVVAVRAHAGFPFGGRVQRTETVVPPVIAPVPAIPPPPPLAIFSLRRIGAIEVESDFSVIHAVHDRGRVDNVRAVAAGDVVH